MEAHEIAERIHEHEEHHEAARPGHESVFRRITAIYVGVVAMLLAISALGVRLPMRFVASASGA